MKKSYNKLVRDKVVFQIKGGKKNKKDFSWYVANKKEYKEKLVEKMQEELAEFKETPNVEEYVDMLDVLDAIADQYGITQTSIYHRRRKKGLAKGFFNERIILEWVEEKE